MNAYYFLLCLTAAFAGPALAVRYLRPILARVLQGLCDTDGAAEFWIRCTYLLAICGTVILTLLFGEYGDNASAVVVLRRALLLISTGVFVSVAIISRNIWNQVRVLLGQSGPPNPIRNDSAQAPAGFMVSPIEQL